MQNYTIFITLTFLVIWEQRHGRWTLMFDAITGKYVIAGTRKGAGNALGSSIEQAVGQTTLGALI
jgi:hypothetical protein